MLRPWLDRTAARSRAATLAVIVAALGYFVDIYDLILFSIVRATSLARSRRDAATPRSSEGIYLVNMQMGGMLVGGILWGVLGDKRGRLSVLFGSIVAVLDREHRERPGARRRRVRGAPASSRASASRASSARASRSSARCMAQGAARLRHRRSSRRVGILGRRRRGCSAARSPSRVVAVGVPHRRRARRSRCSCCAIGVVESGLFQRAHREDATSRAATSSRCSRAGAPRGATSRHPRRRSRSGTSIAILVRCRRSSGARGHRRRRRSRRPRCMFCYIGLVVGDFGVRRAQPDAALAQEGARHVPRR